MMHNPRGSRDMIARYDEGPRLDRKLRQGDEDEPLMLGSGDELRDAAQWP